MTNELTLAKNAMVPINKEDRLNTTQQLGKILAASGYFADVNDIAQAAVKVMAGEELGIAPVAAMMGIHIIKGKVSLSANLIAAQVKKHGYNYRHVQFDNTGCELEFIGKKGEPLGTSSFTETDAKAAGVFSDMYKKFPRNMYFARAISNGAKWYCPEVMSGLPVYVPEELGATVDGDGEIVQELPTERAKAVGQRKLAEMQAAQEFVCVPVEQDVPRQGATEDRPWKNFKGFLEVMAELRTAVGDSAYYDALAVHGKEHANQIKDPEVATAVYSDLKARVEQVQHV